MANTKQNAITQKNDREVVFQSGGQEVTLTITTVMKYFAKGNENVTEQEVVLFMNWCRFQGLNPWINEAYIVKYDKTKPAQNISGKAAFMKRAENDPLYDGFKAGLILGRDGEVVEIEGSFMLKTDTLLGGWCDVYRKDRKFPVSAKVNLEEYHKSQATWNSMPKTMIRKVAIVQALREAFPTKLESLYTEDEFQDVVVIEPEKEIQKEIENNANKKTVVFHKEQTTDIPMETEEQASYDVNSNKSKGVGAQMGIASDPGF